jgi:phosphoribosylglycinamide formyltransferase-1
MAKRIVVLLSGNGSNLQALIDAQQADKLGGDIVAVISNRPEVRGLQRAEEAGIANFVLDHKGFDSREAFDTALLALIQAQTPDLVVLAGFMRILTAEFVQQLQGKLLNIHPSLLPKYQGLNTHQRALDAGDSEHGVSVHFVTEELDGGPCIAQARVAIEAGDDARSLSAKVQVMEHIMYPQVVRWFCEGRLGLEGNTSYFDGEPLPAGGHDIKKDSEH